MKKQVLEVEGIIYGFKSGNLLTDIYLKCETGQIIGILGRNGCGKSSLLKIIFGTLDAENKMIRINGTIIHRPFAKRNLVSYLPQHGFLPKSISLRNTVLKFISSPAKRERIFEDPQITRHLDKKVQELSGGEARYFQILLLLNLDSSFVLLDEPFAAIEPLFKEKVKELIRAYKEEKGFIITDHDYRNVMDIGESIKLVVNGVLKHIKSANELERWGYVPEGTFSVNNH